MGHLIPFITTGMIVLFVVQFTLGFLGQKLWVQFILPMLWLVAGVILLMEGSVEMPRDLIMFVMGFFVLIAIANQGESLRDRKYRKH